MLFLFLLAGCVGNKEQIQSMSIEPAKLSNNEKRFIEVIGGNLLVAMDIEKMNEEAKYIDFWIDYYEKGKFKKKLFQTGSSVNVNENKKKRLIFVRNTFTIDNKDAEMFHFAFIEENGSSSFQTANYIQEQAISETWSQLDKEKSFKLNEPVTIAYLVKTSASSVGVNNESVFSSTDDFPKDLTDDEHVYLLRMQVSN